MKSPEAFSVEKIAVRTSYREVFKQLERAILSGTFQPDDALPTEAQLCEMFGVQRSSVREGIRLLEETGLVGRNSSRRLVVQPSNLYQSAASAIRSAALHSVTLQDMWTVEAELELLACKMAIANADDAFDAKLRANIAFTQASLRNLDDLVVADMEFHDLLFEGAKNMALTIAREPLGILVFATGEFVIKRLEQSAERLVVAHTSVIEAILARDETQALNWLSKHLRDYRKGCIMAGADFDRPISDFLDLEKAMEFAGRSTWANRRPSAVN